MRLRRRWSRWRWDHIGPSKAELRRRYEGSQIQTREAHERAKVAERELRRLRHEFAEWLVEPPHEGGSCTKVRLHTQAEADAFAIKLATELHEPRDAYHAYQCKRCPRHVATMEKFWHVGHDIGTSAAARERRVAQQRERQRRGEQLSSRLSREALEHLRNLA